MGELVGVSRFGANLGAIAQLHDSICITDADFVNGPHIVWVNEGFTRLTGYAPHEVMGQTPRVLQGPRTDRSVLARLRRDLAERQEFEGETINYRRDGSEFVNHWYVIPLAGDDGRPTHYLAVQRDVTEVHHQKAAARVLSAAVEHTMDLVVVLDEAARVVHANPAVEALLERPLASLLGRHLFETGFRPRQRRVLRDVLRGLASDGAWSGELDTRECDGETRRLSVSITRVALDGEVRFVLNARDLTHERRLEYITEATNLVENVGYVFAGLRHELGNPINSIKTAMTVVRQTLTTLPRERLESYLDAVLGEIGRVEYLLRSMASFNATQRPVLEAVPVAAFFERFSRMIRGDFEKRGVRLEWSIDEGAGAMVADARALHQVLLNLLTNAADAVAGRADGRITLSARRRGTFVDIAVADNGPGIPKSQRAHLFKPFHTTKSKGTGLGLAITRKLVTLMRGTVEVSAASGGGTLFVVSLDADASESGKGRSSTRPPPASWSAA
jgi:PAS domain S-box-containing protein